MFICKCLSSSLELYILKCNKTHDKIMEAYAQMKNSCYGDCLTRGLHMVSSLIKAKTVMFVLETSVWNSYLDRLIQFF